MPAVSTAHDYPAGLDSLWAAFGRPAYPRQKYLALGATAVEARLEIVPVRLPVRAHGAGTIVELDAGTSRMTLVWRVESSLPIAGGRVERLFADQVRVALDEDHAFTVAFLQQAMAAHGRRGPRPTLD